MTKNNLGGGIVACALALAAFVSSTQAQNGIEPRYERYNADRKSIEVDGNLDDWAGVNFIEPLFEASDGREGGKGNSTIGEKKLIPHLQSSVAVHGVGQTITRPA